MACERGKRGGTGKREDMLRIPMISNESHSRREHGRYMLGQPGSTQTSAKPRQRGATAVASETNYTVAELATNNDRAGTHAGTPKAVAAAPNPNTRCRDLVAASKQGPLCRRRPSRDSVRGTCRDRQRRRVRGHPDNGVTTDNGKRGCRDSYPQCWGTRDTASTHCLPERATEFDR